MKSPTQKKNYVFDLLMQKINRLCIRFAIFLFFQCFTFSLIGQEISTSKVELKAREFNPVSEIGDDFRGEIENQISSNISKI